MSKFTEWLKEWWVGLLVLFAFISLSFANTLVKTVGSNVK